MDTNHNVHELYFFDRMKSGDESAFDFFFNYYYSGLCVYAGKIMHETHMAEDIVQNVFLSFWKDRDSLNINESVRAYLFRSVHNKCLDAMKHREVVFKHNIRYNADSKPYTEEIWETFVEAELYAILLKAMDKLPAECQKVFRYSRIDLFSHKEIAEKLGLSVKTVENQIGKALRILREALKDYLPVWLMII